MLYSVQEPYFLVLANLQSIQSNKRQKKETLGFSHRFFAYMHLSKREISIPSKKNLESFSHFLAFVINHLGRRAKKFGYIWSLSTARIA